MTKYRLTAFDARMIARYMGTLWRMMEGEDLEHAKRMAYHNVISQKRAAFGRITLRSKYTKDWQDALEA